MGNLPIGLGKKMGAGALVDSKNPRYPTLDFWLVVEPPEKYESVGIMTFPICEKVIQMFQTTVKPPTRYYI